MFAVVNYEAVKQFASDAKPNLQEGQENTEVERQARHDMHVELAIQGLIQSISLGKEDVTKTLQDTLRLLKLWFQHGYKPEIERRIRDCFDTFDNKVWINVIPQIIARIDIQNKIIQQTMLDLLSKIGEKYP